MRTSQVAIGAVAVLAAVISGSCMRQPAAESASASEAEAARPAIEAILGATLPTGSRVTNWAIYHSKDSVFFCRIVMPPDAWRAGLASEAALELSTLSDAVERIEVPEWARHSPTEVAATDELWTSRPTNYATLRCWIVAEDGDEVSVVMIRHTVVEKMPPEVWELVE